MLNPITPAEVLKKAGTWFDRMEKAGLQFDDLQLPIDDPTARARLARFWSNGAQVVSEGDAVKLMPDNLLSLQAWCDLFEPNLSYLEKRELSMIPFSKETLAECRDTHYLIPGYPMTAMEITERFSGTVFHTIRTCFAGHKAVEEDKVRLGWYLVRKQPLAVEGFKYHQWSDQQPDGKRSPQDWRDSVVSESEFQPSVAELVYCIVLCHEAFGVDILQGARVLGFDPQADMTSLGMATIHGRMGTGTLRLDVGGESANDVTKAVLTCRKPLKVWPYLPPA